MSTDSAACSSRDQNPTQGRSLKVKVAGHSQQIDLAVRRWESPCRCGCRKSYCWKVVEDERMDLVDLSHQHSRANLHWVKVVVEPRLKNERHPYYVQV
jgi:hypothetical protein